jgi:SAM-dependent methyltransferase
MSYTEVFDHADELEHERLELLGETLDKGTFRRLTALHPRPGWRCLDIGAGTGGVARWLSDACGDVVATDVEIGSLRRRPHPGVDVLRHDVTSDEFPEGSFDLIHARWVLMHLADRQQILQRMTRWLAPGGWLLIQDATDFAMHSSANLVYRRMASAISRVCRDNIGMDFAWARRFPEPLAGVGLDRLGVDVEVSVVGGDSPMTQFLLRSVHRMHKLLSASGLTDRELADWRKTITANGFFDLGLTNIAAWGRRPA